jgi:uncharacterized membrane protein YhiD involved in acid resistance
MSAIIHIEKRQRGPVGKVIKWIFAGFNVFMLIWLFRALSAVSQLELHSAAEWAGAALGMAIGLGIIFIPWALGNVILGILVLLTRGHKVLVQQTGAEPPAHSSAMQRHVPAALEQSSLDAEALIARYIEKRQTAPAATVPASPSKSFGKRR